MNPSEGYYYFNRALVYERLENFEKAIEDYSQSVDLLKDPPLQYKAYFYRGNCYRYLKQYEKSIADLIKSCEIKKDDAAPYNSLGLSYFENQ